MLNLAPSNLVETSAFVSLFIRVESIRPSASSNHQGPRAGLCMSDGTITLLVNDGKQLRARAKISGLPVVPLKHAHTKEG